ncbi:MAG: MmgE/PrpD family protein, partial [Pseudomonadota bacterium]
MTSLLDAFLDHAQNLNASSLPSEVRRAVSTFILDTMAVGIAGAAMPLTQTIRQSADRWNGVGGALVFGPGNIRMNAANAAFINGFQIHCQEYDCVHEPAVVHPMATIFAALTADVTGRGVAVAGDRFMRAIALSVDMA